MGPSTEPAFIRCVCNDCGPQGQARAAHLTQLLGAQEAGRSLVAEIIVPRQGGGRQGTTGELERLSFLNITHSFLHYTGSFVVF